MTTRGKIWCIIKDAYYGEHNVDLALNVASTACAEVAKQEAIDFAEWIAISYVSAPGEDGMEWEDRQGIRFSSHLLYTLFKQQNP